MKIYDREGATNTARVRIVVAAKRLEDQIEFVSVDLIGAENRQSAFLAMNPMGKIPVLELGDGTCISESTAITEYLDNLDGCPILTGRTPLEKGVIHMMQRRAEIMVLEAVDAYFLHGTRQLGPALRPWRKPDWLGAKEWGERRGAEAVENMSYFDALLSKQPFLAGEAFSMADITLYAGLHLADLSGLTVPADLTALADWWRRVSQIPAVESRSGKAILPEDLARLVA